MNIHAIRIALTVYDIYKAGGMTEMSSEDIFIKLGMDIEVDGENPTGLIHVGQNEVYSWSATHSNNELHISMGSKVDHTDDQYIVIDTETLEMRLC